MKTTTQLGVGNVVPTKGIGAPAQVNAKDALAGLSMKGGNKTAAAGSLLSPAQAKPVTEQLKDVAMEAAYRAHMDWLANNGKPMGLGVREQKGPQKDVKAFLGVDAGSDAAALQFMKDNGILYGENLRTFGVPCDDKMNPIVSDKDRAQFNTIQRLKSEAKDGEGKSAPLKTTAQEIWANNVPNQLALVKPLAAVLTGAQLPYVKDVDLTGGAYLEAVRSAAAGVKDGAVPVTKESVGEVIKGLEAFQAACASAPKDASVGVLEKSHPTQYAVAGFVHDLFVLGRKDTGVYIADDQVVPLGKLSANLAGLDMNPPLAQLRALYATME